MRRAAGVVGCTPASAGFAPGAFSAEPAGVAELLRESLPARGVWDLKIALEFSPYLLSRCFLYAVHTHTYTHTQKLEFSQCC